MKSIMFIDRDSQLCRAARSLAEILDIPFDHVARSNDVRRLIGTGNVGMIIANSEITTIRFEDLATEINTIIKRNIIPEFPVYYICSDSPEPDENLPPNIPSSYLIKRSGGLERIYRLVEKTLLSDQEIAQSGGFIHYSEEHKEYLDKYKTSLRDLKRIVAKALES